MQMHCIEITKAAIEILNPGQPVVDVSDQPIYAISKHLQLIYPDQYGLHKYLPMFGGLHIEKLLLELHGQIIAGNGLPEILDISKLSYDWGRKYIGKRFCNNKFKICTSGVCCCEV